MSVEAGATNQTAAPGSQGPVVEQLDSVPLYTRRVGASAAGRNGDRIEAVLDGQPFVESTGMWVGCEGAPATAWFDLSGEFRRLVASAALQYHTPPELVASVTIRGDGRTLAEFIAEEGVITPVDVNVEGVDRLEVAAIASGAACTASTIPYGALGDARLVPAEDG